MWRRLEQKFGREKLRFPKEIMWLGGAPGAGKGTNTPFIVRERGITAPAIVISDLLNSPEMQKLKDTGQLVGDREVITLLFGKLLDPEFQSGVVVDGFHGRRSRSKPSRCCTTRCWNCGVTSFRPPVARVPAPTVPDYGVVRG